MSKLEKLIAKLLNEQASFTWQELETLLRRLGYQQLQGQGSRIKFHQILREKPGTSSAGRDSASFVRTILF